MRRKSESSSGEIKWHVRGDTRQRDSAERQLSSLLKDFSTWPLKDFAARWWPGDYRLLTLTSVQPCDLNVVVRCHSSAGSDSIDISIEAQVRSLGRARSLKTSEKEALAAAGFESSGVQRDERSRSPEQTVASQLLRGMESAFAMVGRPVLAYTIEEGSRLDEMPVLQNIRTHELLSLLRAAGFRAQLADLSTPNESRSEPVIAVEAAGGFTITLAEPKEFAYLTLRFRANAGTALDDVLLQALNRQLFTGAAHVNSEGRLELRYNLCISGGLSHAAIRDRVDEWVESLNIARNWTKPVNSASETAAASVH